MYPISNEVKALFESEQKQILRITGGEKSPISKSVGPSAMASFSDAIAADALNLSVDITPVQSGSGDPSPTNVRPISGWTGANVSATGKNLVDIGRFADEYPDYCSYSDGVLSVASYGDLYRKGINVFIPEGALINCTITPYTASNVRIRLVFSSGNHVDKVQSDFPYRIPNNIVAIRFNWSQGGTFSISDFQAELGSTATAYEPYAGTSYPISWQSEAGTVYGGTLDVTTGLLTVTMAEVDMGTLHWSMTDGNIFYDNSITNKKRKSQGVICSNYANPYNYNTSLVRMADKTVQNRTDSDVIYIKDTAYSNTATFKTAMSGVQLVYELATPITYQLTPQQVALLQGQNNVWADCGDVTVEYATGYEYEINITDADVVLNSFSIDRYACNGTKLEVGTAVASEMSLKLNNADGRYDDVVFEGAELYVEIGIADWTQENPNIIYIPCGYFTPDEQPRTRDIITLHALDRMMNFDAIPPQLTPWTDNNGNVMTDNYGNVIYLCADLSLPATVSGLIQQACDICQVPFTQDLSTLPNYNLTISVLPALQQDITFRNIIQWCAGIMGTNAWIDWEGKLRFSWYGTSSVYTTTMANRFSSDLSEDDITITGVGFTTGENAVVLSGDPGYIIDMSDNPLAGLVITQALPGIGNVINGFTYRPFTASVFNAPYLWPMDAVMFTDKNGDSYTCALTNVNFGINGATALQSIGESLKTNSGARPSGLTAAQLRVINQLNASLDQEGIFNRLTNNGEVQGLILYDGKVYLNASYINTGFLSANRIKGGTIDGNTVNAKQFQVIDGDGNVVATFDSVITLGEPTNKHVEIDSNSFDIYDSNDVNFVSIGDLRDSDGYCEFTDTFVGDGSKTVFWLLHEAAIVISVKVNGQTTPYTTNLGYYISFSTAPSSGSTIEIVYKTNVKLYYFNFGEQYSTDPRTKGVYSVSQGWVVEASGTASNASGAGCVASGNYSHAEGVNSVASGEGSHAEGYGSTGWIGGKSHPGNVASGQGSHAEGYFTAASGNYSHSEGDKSAASGQGSHAEGKQTVASGNNSHAEGYSTQATGHGSHAEGVGTISNKESQHVVGRWNVADPAGSSSLTYIEIVGNGTENSRLNIRTLDYNGNEWINGTLTQASDNRLKTEDGEVPDVSGVKARMFRWNDKKLRHDDKVHLGYFAQDVEKVAPYLVSEDDMGYKSLDYIGFLVAKIASLEKRVAELERRINTCR